MRGRKWFFVLLVLSVPILALIILRRHVDRDISNLIVFLFAITFYFSIVFFHYFRRRQSRSETILLQIENKKDSAATILLSLIFIGIGFGLIVEDLFSSHEVEFIQWVNNIVILFSGLTGLVTSQKKTIFTQTGLFSGPSFYRWRDIRSYRWQENQLELHTDSFFSPYLVTIDPQRKNEVDTLLNKMTGKQSAFSGS